MSYKTDKLVELFPEAYAADDQSALLHKLLDAIGAELMVADENVKLLLKAHWVDYASGEALDGLGAIYGVSRRLLRSGLLEGDEAFRRRLKSTVPLYTGGGTRKAVLGAVRSALGLPFNLDELNLTLSFDAEFVALVREAIRAELEAKNKTVASPFANLRQGITLSNLLATVRNLAQTQEQQRIREEQIDQLQQARLQTQLHTIRQQLEDLIILEEFAPTGVQRKTGLGDVQSIEGAQEVQIELLDGTADVADVYPTFRWAFEISSVYEIVFIMVDGDGAQSGFRASRPLRFEAGERLDFRSDDTGTLTASVGERDLTSEFVDLADPAAPARMPEVPAGYSLWRFRNEAGNYEHGTFDIDSFDPSAAFTVEMIWLRYTPLTFTVTMPYFLRSAVEQIRRNNHYAGDLFVHEGLSIEHIPEVVNQTRVAGVQAIVQFMLNFYEDHRTSERFYSIGTLRHRESVDAKEKFTIGNVNRIPETHAQADRFTFGGVFGLATFDTNFVYYDERPEGAFDDVDYDETKYTD